MTDGRHALAEERSLALHKLVAERLRADPGLLDRARDRVRSWLRDGSVARPLAEEWEEVLSHPVEAVAAVLSDAGQRARALRQTSPFAGVIDPRTRWAVWRSAAQRPGFQ